jgi:transcriptional regulator
MYIPSSFEMNDRTTIFAAIESHPFAALITTRDRHMSVSHLPIWLDRDEGVLYGHVARANPHWQALESADELLLLFTGPQGYISPGWYADPQLVPTWNYVAVAVRGRATLLPDPVDARLLVERLSAQHEARFAKPWTIDKLPDSKIAVLLRAIVAFRIDVDRIEAKAKLGQNRAPADIAGAIAGLHASTTPSGEVALADAMQRVLDGGAPS